jgi:hypothetical protein
MCSRASSNHGRVMSCIVPSSPSAEESELRSKREAPRVPTKSSGSAGPSSRQTISLVARARVARDWARARPTVANPLKPSVRSRPVFTCPVPDANSVLQRSRTSRASPLVPKYGCEFVAKLQRRFSPSHLIRSSSYSWAMLRTGCAGLCRCIVGHDDDHMHATCLAQCGSGAVCAGRIVAGGLPYTVTRTPSFTVFKLTAAWPMRVHHEYTTGF